MARSLCIVLSAQQNLELEHARDKHSLPYIRERAAAILKVAGGRSARDVALHGLLKPRLPDTVYDWVKRYRGGGLKALYIRPGRGRKPAFSPSLR